MTTASTPGGMSGTHLRSGTASWFMRWVHSRIQPS